MKGFGSERLQAKGLSREVEENMSAVSLLILCSSFLVIASAVAISLHRDLPETHMNVVSLRFIKCTFLSACVTEKF